MTEQNKDSGSWTPTKQQQDYYNLAKSAKDKSNEWMTIDEFQQESNEGWCWIVYKGRVVVAYHDYRQKFRPNRLSDNMFMTECISHAMPIRNPDPPDVL